MVVMSAEVELYLASSRSLKDKRRVVNSLKERVRSRFHVAIAEVDYQDLWQRCVLGVATVSSSFKQAEDVMNRVVRFMEEDLRVEVVDHYIEQR